MANSNTNGRITNQAHVYDQTQVVATFRQRVIDRFQIGSGNRIYTYEEYLTLPTSERSNDEADAVDQRFARYTLEWLGFQEGDWNYNRPQSGQKANRPDYTINALVGTAFIWEDKNSTIDLDNEHLKQMRRYGIGTAGYAVWCNMRRILAVRFLLSDTLKYETLADVSVEQLFGSQSSLPSFDDTQATNLALFKLLFSKERFTQFTQLVSNICVDEQVFESQSVPLDKPPAMQSFIQGSRQSLDHLRLAALLQVREALDNRNRLIQEEADLRKEWENARDEFIDKIKFSASDLDIISQRVFEEIERITSRLGEVGSHEISKVREIIEQTLGMVKLPASLSLHFGIWLERAIRITDLGIKM